VHTIILAYSIAYIILNQILDFKNKYTSCGFALLISIHNFTIFAENKVQRKLNRPIYLYNILYY